MIGVIVGIVAVFSLNVRVMVFSGGYMPFLNAPMLVLQDLIWNAIVFGILGALYERHQGGPSTRGSTEFDDMKEFDN